MKHPQAQKITKQQLQHFLLLRKDKDYRYEVKSALVIGKKLTEELYSQAKAILVTSLDHLPFRCSTVPIYLTTEEELKKISGVENPEPIAMEISLPSKENFENSRRILVLDRLQDPGNIGTLVRSALAFDFDGIYFIEPICDPFNDKVIRASKGAIFTIPLKVGNKEEITEWLKMRHIPLLIADLEGENPHFSTRVDSVALVLGHEGQGVNPYFKEKGALVKIPISATTESLNVAIAGSIMMYLLRESHVKI